MHAIRTPFLNFVQNPFEQNTDSINFHSDGLIVIHNGTIVDCGAWSSLSPIYPDIPLTTYSSDCIAMPGFIDLHCHYPQATMIGSWGNTLLEWLNDFTFPAETKFNDSVFSQKIAHMWVDICIQNGITTPVSFCTVHPQSVDAFFQATDNAGMRAIGGKVLMDRNAPAELLDTAQTSYDDSAALVDKWHNKNRLHYAVTPRFAGTSTPEQLELASTLWHSKDDLYLQSHISENKDEILWTKGLFPHCDDYFAVYEHYNLVGPRAIYAHGIHLTHDELNRFHQTGAVLAHCPTSNLFLGSGLLDMNKIIKHDIKFGIGTDIGAGTHYSPFQTLNAMYQTAQLNGLAITPAQAIWSMTTGAAESLDLGHSIGKIQKGYDADFIILEPKNNPALELRTAHCDSLEEKLGVYCTLGDDRLVSACYIAGINKKP